MKKTSKTKIAFTYATAMFDATSSHDKMLKEITSLLEALQKDNSLSNFLSNPTIDIAIKKQTLESLKLSTELQNSILVITENNRSENLTDILNEFIKIYYNKKNIVMIDVTSTYLLKDKQLKDLQKKLTLKLNQDVIINNIVDQDILGGLIIKYNSQMLDSSVLGKIKNIEKLMKGETLWA